MRYWRVISLLRGRPERDVFERAAACCRGDTPAERIVGANVLAQLGFGDRDGVRPFTEETVPVLRSLLDDKNDDAVAAAIHALAHHRYAVPGDFRELARHPSQPIREAVAHVLSGHDHAEAVALLIELTKDLDDSVRDWATFAIARQCDADSADIRKALADRLDDSDAEVRGEAMVGLARRRDPSVIDCIAAALDASDPNQLVFDAAEEVLLAIPDESRLTTALAKWRNA